MLKGVLIFILGLLIFQGGHAQGNKVPQDTILYYLKDSGQITNKDSADYSLFIMPRDTANGLFPIIEFYPNGKRKLMGLTHSQLPHLKLEGPAIRFYPNGKRKNMETYKDGASVGEILTYYPNGQLYTIEKYDKTNKLNPYKLLTIECRDSTGKILAENGNGEWLKYDEGYKNISEEGPIVNGVKEGEWRGKTIYVSKFNCLYKMGESISGVGYDLAGNAHPFKKDMILPDYKGGMNGFYAFLQHNLHYPEYERDHNMTGRVIITFFVEIDGKLTEAKVARSLSPKLDQEALRVVRLANQWIPGIQYGVPARVSYAVPIAFETGN